MLSIEKEKRRRDTRGMKKQKKKRKQNKNEESRKPREREGENERGQEVTNVMIIMEKGIKDDFLINHQYPKRQKLEEMLSSFSIMTSSTSNCQSKSETVTGIKIIMNIF